LEGLSEREHQRISATLSAVPPNVESLLEVGNNDGRMSEALQGRVGTYVALDLPRKGGNVRNQVFGTIARLPFPDRAFDIVVCCEVLEHLPEAVYRAGLKELSRVASRHVLVTVPYRQRVEYELTRCAACGFVGHWTSHVRSFSEDSIRDLLEGWRPIEVRPFGQKVNGYAPGWLYWLQYRLGVYTPRPWACTACRQMATAPEPLPGRLVRSMIWRFEKSSPKRPAWVLGLWTR
jgi:hypothetical protein